MPHKQFHGVVQPDELKDLKAVFDRACLATNLTPGSAGADNMALKVMTLYQAGIEDQGQLFEAAIRLLELPDPEEQDQTAA